MKILHIITGLSTGGAEMMLVKTISGLSDCEHLVIVLGDWEGSAVHRQLQLMQVPVAFIRISKNLTWPSRLYKVLGLAQRFKPDATVAWMYHAMLASVIFKCCLRSTRLAWNIRHSIHDISKETRSVRLILRLCRRFSFMPKVLLYNSHTARGQHEILGFPTEKGIVIPNCFELPQINSALTEQRRKALQINHGDILITHVARFHPMKAHNLFLRAVAIVKNKRKNLAVVMIGPGVDSGNKVLVEEIKRLGLDQVLLMGERSDAKEVISASDLLVSSSMWGEGFSNVLGEAMSFGVPCVATDVGDAKLLLGDAGEVVAPGNADALAAAIEKVLAEDERKKQTRSECARNRVSNLYSMEAVANAYREALANCP